MSIEHAAAVGADVYLSSCVAASGELGTVDGAEALSATLDINPCGTLVSTRIESGPRGTGTKGVHIPGCAGSNAEGHLVGVGQGGRGLGECGTKVGRVEDTNIRGNPDVASGSGVHSDIPHGSSTAKLAARCKGSAGVLAHVKIGGGASVEICVVLLVRHDHGARRQAGDGRKRALVLRAQDAV